MQLSYNFANQIATLLQSNVARIEIVFLNNTPVDATINSVNIVDTGTAVRVNFSLTVPVSSADTITDINLYDANNILLATDSVSFDVSQTVDIVYAINIPYGGGGGAPPA